MAARTTEQRIQGQRKEQRRQQRKRKEHDVRLLHLWTTLVILQEIVEQWSTMCQTHSMCKHQMQQDNGMINKMDTMPIGTTVTLLVFPAIICIHIYCITSTSTTHWSGEHFPNSTCNTYDDNISTSTQHGIILCECS